MSNAPAARRAGWTTALPGGSDGRGGAPPGRLAGLRGALHAEWTKLRTLPGTPWLAAGIVAATVPVSIAATAAVRCPSGGCGVDPARLSLAGVDLGQAVAAILAVLVISSQCSTGMIRMTMTAVPRRITVLAAKAAIVSGLVLVAGIVAVGGSLLAGHAILSGHGFTPAHGYPPLTLARGPVLRARRRVGPLPDPDRAAQPRRRHDHPGCRAGHRSRPRPALPGADPRRRRARHPLAQRNRAVRADDRRAGHPGHRRPAQPAHQPLGRPGRARRLGGGRAAARR